MININKFNTLADYLEGGNLLHDECRVSQIGPSSDMRIMYDMPNVLTKNRVVGAGNLSQNEVAMVVKDRLDGKIKFIPQRYFDGNSLDTSLYELKDFIRYRGEGSKQLMIYKTNNGSVKWGRNNYYKINVPSELLSSGGTITLKVTINGTTRTTSYTWSSATTLSTIASQLYNSISGNAMSSINGESGWYIGYTSGEDFIRSSVGTYSNSTLATDTGTTSGITITDLSKNSKYNGTTLNSSTHRGWANQYLTAIFASDSTVLSGLRAAYNTTGNLHSQACYDRMTLTASGGVVTESQTNLEYRCGANLSKYRSWATNLTSADATDLANLYTGSGPVSKSTFSGLSSGTTEQQAIYNYLSGSTLDQKYDSYLISRMVDPDYNGGVCKFSKNNGVEVCQILGNVTTEYFDGTFVPAFPAAYNAVRITDADLCPNGAGLPSAHEIACFMSDVEPDRFSAINSAIDKMVGGTKLTTGAYYWSAVEYYSNLACSYTGSSGTLDGNYKYYSLTVRPALAYSVS